MKRIGVFIALAISVVFSLTGCAVPKNNYQNRSESVSEPPIGSISTSQVGDVLLRQGKFTEHAAIYVPTRISPVWAYTLYPGTYLKQGNDDIGEYFYPGGPDAGRIEKAAIADPWISVLVKKDRSLCIVTAFNVSACGAPGGYEHRSVPVQTQDSFQQTLIYNGKVGNKLNIAYREFSANHARPAFNNSVEYDLTESNIVGYKGAQIEVIEATNRHIKYKVIRNFNDAR
jgi:hypothetical protein